MLKLITHPNKILQEKLTDFDFQNSVMDPRQLEENMIQIMLASQGIGLAANQVGINARVFVMKPHNLKDIYTPFALFNPTIVAEDTEEILGDEGCLSFPGIYFKIKRPMHVIAEFFDRDSNKCIIRLDGIDARCFLHELDHLNGICFTEKVSKLKLAMALKKQRKRYG